MKITIYELLGLIKDGKAPKKIRIRGFEFIIGGESSIENYYLLEETSERWLDAIDIRLYDEVEIIEEEQNIKELWIDDSGYIHTELGSWKGRKMDIAFATKINEVIKELNKKKNNEKLL